MNKLYFLYAAYVVTWVVHISYLLILGRKAARLRREIEDLKR
ncbi:MAG: CcmD family protein [Acidobacteriia bacterium]|jgi:CcmD family protein|nr:CcmD family protein [Terriglobia bacterium]